MEKKYQIPLPKQKEGSEKNIESTVETTSEEKAVFLFKAARQRLLNVNQWDQLCGPMSAAFRLTDSKGNEISGEVNKGYYFKIDIPGPGSATGDGYDWVLVEEIKEEKIDDGEFILLRVRPADNPTTSSDDVAHFLSDKATSNFVVQRKGTIVTAAVYGRNEKPNTNAVSNVIDKIRNAIVGTSAIAGVSDAQWKSLTKGLLGD